MPTKKLAYLFEIGKINHPSLEEETANINWNNHPTYQGVSIKHLIKGESTEGKLSCHLVRVEGGCELKKHVHEGEWELHEVLDGQGTCYLDNKKLVYEPGIMTVIPKNTNHKVIAGKEGLYILAKFFPALV